LGDFGARKSPEFVAPVNEESPIITSSARSLSDPEAAEQREARHRRDEQPGDDDEGGAPPPSRANQIARPTMA